MKHIKLLLAAAAIASLSLFTACKSTSGGSGASGEYSASATSSTRTIVDPNYFNVVQQGDTIYIAGTPEGAAAAEAGGSVPNPKTFTDIPGGVTIVIQADTPAMESRLKAEVTRQNGIELN